MFTLIFRHDLLEGSGEELRNVSRPLFEWLVSLVEPSSADAGDARARAATLWASVHGIAMLSSTGALELAATGIPASELVDRVVRNSLR